MRLFIQDSLNESELAQRLADLPAFTPPAGGWMQLQRKRLAQRRRRVAGTGVGGFALAASLVLAVGLPRLAPDPAPILVQPQAQSQLAQLMQRSQILERELAAARPQVAQWSGAQAVQVSRLQEGLSVVDYQLNFADSDDAERLWQRRIQLMSTLVQLHQQPAPMLVQAAYQY